MDREALEQALSQQLPAQLVRDLVSSFIEMRHDVASKTLGRTAPGKFVETLVQILEYLETGTFTQKPRVDRYLKGLENRSSILNDDLRLCVSRVARAMYTLRNKRNIAHKGDVDPNQYDLMFLFNAGQWILAELLRQTSNLTMEEAGRIVATLYLPVGDLVEDFGTKRLVLGTKRRLTTKEEIMILLHSVYPEERSKEWIIASIDRRNEQTVKRGLRELWQAKLVETLADDMYKLTKQGVVEARALVSQLR